MQASLVASLDRRKATLCSGDCFLALCFTGRRTWSISLDPLANMPLPVYLCTRGATVTKIYYRGNEPKICPRKDCTVSPPPRQMQPNYHWSRLLFPSLLIRFDNRTHIASLSSGQEIVSVTNGNSVTFVAEEGIYKPRPSLLTSCIQCIQ